MALWRISAQRTKRITTRHGALARQIDEVMTIEMRLLLTPGQNALQTLRSSTRKIVKRVGKSY